MKHGIDAGLRSSALAIFAALGLLTVGLAPAAQAEDTYPNHQIHLLVPFAPGGASDGSARVVAEQLTKQLGQTVVVENRPGASGNVCGEFLARAAPDGYTIMLGYNGQMTINPHLFAHMGFDPQNDLMTIGKIGEYPSLMVVYPELDVKTLKDVIALSKTSPEGLAYGTSGPGSLEHLIGVLLTQRTGAHLLHIPYKGAGPALSDAMGGHIPIALTSIAGGQAFVKSGKLRPIAVSGAQRSAIMPDVPTFEESGVRNFDLKSWIGLFAPAKTPKAVIDKLNAELNKALANPDLKDKLNILGISVAPGTPAGFSEAIKAELTLMGPIVKAADITPE